MLLLATLLVAASLAAAAPGLVEFGPQAGSFPLVARRQAAPIWVDAADHAVARLAAGLLADDVERVAGVKPAVVHEDPSGEHVVLLGTLGHSRLLDRLAADGKLDVSGIKGKWEAHLLATVDQPWPGVKSALVIAGADRRGTAYGVFALSEAIGVSPWYWWADVPPAHHDQLFIAGGAHVVGPPSVKYRGVFLNDEFAGLHPWATRTFDKEHRHLGPRTYAKVFELLLRLKANYCWPAMQGGTRFFNVYPENKQVADNYAIVMGSCHCEPLLFNNVEGGEWDERRDGPWNFLTNRERILAAWERRLRENGPFENTFTLGLRGIHDRPIQGGKTVAEQAAILQQAVDAQRELLQRLVRPDVPQLFCPYREVQRLYEAGVRVPDDVTLVWADDNYGHLRRLSSPAEQARAGRAGIYFHLKFFLNTWLSSYGPPQLAFELRKAWDYGADRLWVFNVGDLKPAEKELTFVLQTAWDIGRWPPQTADGFVTEWAAATFGPEHSADIADLLRAYYRLAARGVPEFVDRGWGGATSPHEVAARLAAYQRLGDQAAELARKLPLTLADAYFELVLFPVQGARLVNEKVLLARQGRTPEARATLDRLAELTRRYHETIAGGKWNRMRGGYPKGEPVAQPTTRMKHPDFEPATPTPAASFVRQHARADAAPTVLPGLGFVDGVTLWPLTAPSLSPEQVGEAAWVEYELDAPPGPGVLGLRTLPTQRLQLTRGLRYGVSLNGAPPVVFETQADEGDGAWWENVRRGYAVRRVPYPAEAARRAVVRLYLLDPGLVLQDLGFAPL